NSAEIGSLSDRGAASSLDAGARPSLSLHGKETATAWLKHVDLAWAALLIWLTGTLALGFRVGSSSRVLARLARFSLPSIVDERIVEIADECAERMGVRRQFALVSGRGHVFMPMTWGFWRPVVLLPEEAESWSA